jgi:hypothetical protein
MVQVWDGVELAEESGRHAPKNFGVFAGWRNEWTAGYAHHLMWVD